MDENLSFACRTLADWATLHGIGQIRTALQHASTVAGQAESTDQLVSVLRSFAAGELPAEPEEPGAKTPARTTTKGKPAAADPEA